MFKNSLLILCLASTMASWASQPTKGPAQLSCGKKMAYVALNTLGWGLATASLVYTVVAAVADYEDNGFVSDAWSQVKGSTGSLIINAGGFALASFCWLKDLKAVGWLCCKKKCNSNDGAVTTFDALLHSISLQPVDSATLLTVNTSEDAESDS